MDAIESGRAGATAARPSPSPTAARGRWLCRGLVEALAMEHGYTILLDRSLPLAKFFHTEHVPVSGLAEK